jgi:hypothetical protein
MNSESDVTDVPDGVCEDIEIAQIAVLARGGIALLARAKSSLGLAGQGGQGCKQKKLKTKRAE